MQMKYVSNVDFGFYLAGLWEGDGHISMPGVKQRFNPRWNITFHEKDYALAQALQHRLGGFIRHKTKNHAKVLTLSAVSDLKALVRLTQNAYRSPKIRQVNLLIIWLNKHHNTNFGIIYENKSSLNNNAWLAGFIDADGSFGIRHTQALQNQKRRVACRFRLEQRMVDPKSGVSYKPLMQHISQTLGLRLNTRTQKKSKRTYFLVESSSVATNTKLVSYLSTYPLFSSKQSSFHIWCMVHAKLKSRLAYAPEYAQALKTLKHAINMDASICELHLKKL